MLCVAKDSPKNRRMNLLSRVGFFVPVIFINAGVVL